MILNSKNKFYFFAFWVRFFVFSAKKYILNMNCELLQQIIINLSFKYFCDKKMFAR